MSQPSPEHNRPVNVLRYGIVSIEGDTITCALGDDLMIYVPIVGVCQIIGGDADREQARIQADDTLRDSLLTLDFNILQDGKRIRAPLACISWTRLHTWLAGIPLDQVPDPQTRAKLAAMKRELADLVYAYFGRTLLPADLKQEQEAHLTAEQRQFYASMEDVYQLNHRMDDLLTTIQELKEDVNHLKAVVALEPEQGELIDKNQKRQFEAIIGILAKLAEHKEKGSFEEVYAEMKRQIGFTNYMTLPVRKWEPLIRYCILLHNRYTHNAPLPRVFTLALETKSQGSLFG